MFDNPAVEARSPEDEAQRILDTVWSDLRQPFGSVIPIDPIRIATALGVDVAESDFDSNVAGAIVKELGTDPTILLNKNDHPNRQRFTTAHELGHYVLRASDPDDYEYIDRRDELSSTGTNPEERFANSFAAALLMPEREVRAAIREGYDVVGLAYRFRVSQDAMTFRLKNLGIIV